MGVLDDAIREHLELKLKNGASEDEVRRQEAEALGAVKREPTPEQEAAADEDELHIGEPEHGPFEAAASEAEPEGDSVPFDGDEGEAAFEERTSAPAAADETAVVERDAGDYVGAPESDDEAALAEGEPDAVGFVERRELAEDTVLIERGEGEVEVVFVEEAEPADRPSAQDVVLEPPLGERLADEEAALEAERSAEALEEARPREAGDPGEGDDDVLEETPDFLQETPEHDRLWFEQKPPRDFDFD